MHETRLAPASAYFSTLTRAWELALGAILAIAAPHLKRIPRRLGAPLGLLGLTAIGTAAVFRSNDAVSELSRATADGGIGARNRRRVVRDGRLAPARALGVLPLRFIGDRSYAYYLWHWPVLILAAEYEGRSLSVGTNLVLLVVAFGALMPDLRFL